MARKIIPAGKMPGDRTFRVGEDTAFSKALKKAPPASQRTARTPNGKIAPSTSPKPASRSASRSKAPRVQDNTPGMSVPAIASQRDLRPVANTSSQGVAGFRGPGASRPSPPNPVPGRSPSKALSKNPTREYQRAKKVDIWGRPVKRNK